MWDFKVFDLVFGISLELIDWVIFDMFVLWECVEMVGKVLVFGGVLCCYVVIMI